MAESDWVDVSEMDTETPQNKSLMDMVSSIILNAPSKVEEKIASRPSSMAQAIQEPPTIESLKQHPFKTPLRTVSSAFETLEGIPADIGLALQRGKPQDILGDIGKTLVGERPAEIGDIFRGSGVPEPLSATGGLLLTALKGTPTATLGEITMSPAVKAVKYLGNTAKQFGMPAVTKAMQFMAGIPQAHSEFALNNPELLQKANLQKLGQEATGLMKSVIVPLEDSPKAKVNLKPTFDKLEELRIQTKTGELTSSAAQLSNKEQEFISNTLMELKGYAGDNQPTFARVRFLLGKMDDILSPVYKQRMAGIEPVTDSFQNIVRYMRGALRSSINDTNYPQANKALKLYEKYSTAKNVEKNFSKVNISFMKSLPIRLAIMGVGTGMRYPMAGLMALPMTMPLAYKGLIGGVDVGQKILSEPTIMLDMMEKAGLGESKQEGKWVDVE